MVINIVFDYDTFEIYNNAMNLIALLVGNSDRRTLFEIADPRSFVPAMLCAIFHVIVNRRTFDTEDKEKSPENHQMPAD